MPSTARTRCSASWVARPLRPRPPPWPRSSAADVVYADMNAGDPAVKARSPTRWSTPVRRRLGHRFGAGLRSGDQRGDQRCRPAQAARVFGALGAPVEDIGGAPGDASARKLLRSTFMKGLGALIVESNAAGRAAGAEDLGAEADGRRAQRGGGCAGPVTTARSSTPRGADRDRRRRRSGQLLGQRPVMTRAAAECTTRSRRRARPDRRPLGRLRTLAVANIGDARDRMGMFDGGIRSLWRGARLAGRARTVWTRPGDNQAIHHALSHCRPGDVSSSTAAVTPPGP